MPEHCMYCGSQVGCDCREPSPSERLRNLCAALSEQADESPFTREEWERIDAENVSLRSENKRLHAFIANPPKHYWWGAGEKDCPKDIRGGNGKLHTLRCKVCGEDFNGDEICRVTVTATGEQK